MTTRCTLQVLIPEPMSGRVLIAWHRPTRSWTLPAGELLEGEDMTSAAHRIVTDAVSLGVQIGWVADIAVDPAGVRVLIPGRHVTGRPAARGSYTRCAWADRDQLPQLLPPSQMRQILTATRRPWSFQADHHQGSETGNAS